MSEFSGGMEQYRTGLVDLLEIYHARQLQDQILSQLRRLRASNQEVSLRELSKRREVIGYYEALLLTVADMRHQLGDSALES